MERPRRILDTPLDEIHDSDLLGLVSELYEVTTVPPANNRSLFSFLSQCPYPAGYGKRYKLERDRLTPGRLLLRKVGTFENTAIYKMCNELAQMQNQTAEIALNMNLYAFLNKYLPDYEAKPKKRGYDPRDWR